MGTFTKKQQFKSRAVKSRQDFIAKLSYNCHHKTIISQQERLAYHEFLRDFQFQSKARYVGSVESEPAGRRQNIKLDMGFVGLPFDPRDKAAVAPTHWVRLKCFKLY